MAYKTHTGKINSKLFEMTMSVYKFLNSWVLRHQEKVRSDGGVVFCSCKARR